jgi:hypothetical protein
MPVAIDDGSAPTELMTTPTRTPLGIPTGSGAHVSAPVPVATPAPVAAPAAPAPKPPVTPAAAPARKTNTAVAVLVAVAALVVIAVAVGVWLGREPGATAPVDPAPAPVTAPAPEAAPPQPIAAPGASQAPPTDTITPPPVTPPPPVQLAAPPPSSAATSAPATTPRSGSTTARGDAGKAAKPEPVVVPPANPARGTPPPPAPATDDSLVAFGNIKFLAVNGRRTTDRDVLINFGGGQISVMSRDGGGAIVTLPYVRIRRATFVSARDPKWDPGLAAPPADLDVGTFIRQARPWLVVQTSDAFAIFRLDDRSVARFLETLESRTGIKVDRPASSGK